VLIHYPPPARAPSRALTLAQLQVLLASFLAMPVSSTQCFVGAVIAVGMVSGGGRAAVSWPMIRKIFVGWIITVPVAGALSALIFWSLKSTITGVSA
jgi:phosphate/sulfate permease